MYVWPSLNGKIAVYSVIFSIALLLMPPPPQSAQPTQERPEAVRQVSSASGIDPAGVQMGPDFACVMKAAWGAGSGDSGPCRPVPRPRDTVPTGVPLFIRI